MTVKFVDSTTGEVIEKEKGEGINIAWVLIAAALIVGFFIGGGVGTYIAQDQISDLKVQLERTEVIR